MISFRIHKLIELYVEHGKQNRKQKCWNNFGWIGFMFFFFYKAIDYALDSCCCFWRWSSSQIFFQLHFFLNVFFSISLLLLSLSHTQGFAFFVYFVVIYLFYLFFVQLLVQTGDNCLCLLCNVSVSFFFFIFFFIYSRSNRTNGRKEINKRINNRSTPNPQYYIICCCCCCCCSLFVYVSTMYYLHKYHSHWCLFVIFHVQRRAE